MMARKGTYASYVDELERVDRVLSGAKHVPLTPEQREAKIVEMRAEGRREAAQRRRHGYASDT